MHKYDRIYLREIVYLSEVDQQVRLFSFFVTLFMLDYTNECAVFCSRSHCGNFA